MRFFTSAWRDGELSDEDFENACAAYDQRLHEIHYTFPAKLSEFVATVSLHDAEIRMARARRDRTFQLGLRAGDQQRGYGDVDLNYQGVVALEGIPSVAGVLNQRDAEIVRDEVDVASSTANSFEHRFLIAPAGELLIRFHDFDFAVTSVARREFKRGNPVFIDAADV
jgi:hypothetical protein